MSTTADSARAVSVINPTGDYVSAVFDVSGGPDTVLKIRWSGGGAPIAALVAVFDPNRGIRLNKWMRADETLEIGPSSASLGGLHGVITEGQWEMRVFLPLAAGEGCALVAELAPGTVCGESPRQSRFMERYDPKTVVKRGARWYKGDFHTHTTLSDGKETPETATEKAERMGLDFYVPTEHNVMHASWPKTELLIVPGLEITAPGGHFNVFGITSPPDGLFDSRNAQYGFIATRALNTLLSQCAGCVCSLNHPFLREWSWTARDTPLDRFQALEVINDPTYTYANDGNEAALRLWTRLWNDGRRICGVGGSDSHNLEHERYDGANEPSVPGDPATWVFCEELCGGALLESVRACHVYVTRRGLRLDISIFANNDRILPGDCVNGGARVKFQIALADRENAARLDVRWIVNGDTRGTSALETVAAEFSVDADTLEYGWVRADFRDAGGSLIGFTNPVYWGSKSPVLTTFAEAASGIVTGDKP